MIVLYANQFLPDRFSTYALDLAHGRSVAQAQGVSTLNDCSPALSVGVRNFNIMENMIEAKPEKFIGSKEYDSDRLDAELKEECIEMIARHRMNRKIGKAQYSLLQSNCQCGWQVESFWS